MNKVLIGVGVIVLAVLAAAGGFWGGMTYQANQSSQVQTAFFNERGGGPPQFQNGDRSQIPGAGQTRFGGQGGGTNGQVKSLDGDLLQVSTAQDVTTVSLTAETVITKSTTGIADDLQPGTRVLVIGEKNQDGVLVATSIRILDDGAFPGFAGPPTGATPAAP